MRGFNQDNDVKVMMHQNKQTEPLHVACVYYCQSVCVPLQSALEPLCTSPQSVPRIYVLDNLKLQATMIYDAE